MAISSAQVKQLRDLTGAGMMDCKHALEEAEGDMDRAKEILRTRGLAAAAKRAGRVAGQGVVDAYIHMQGTLGVLIEVNSETDFVANTDDFRALARDLAMHIAAAAPRWISREDVPDDLVDGERKIFEEQAREDGKPDEIIPKIVEGKLEAFYKETCLLDQPWIRDDAKTIGDLVAGTSAKVGEKIQVGRFARYRVGEAEDG